MSSCRKKLHENSSKKWCLRKLHHSYKCTLSCHTSSHTKFLQVQTSKQTKEIFRGVFFQILCYQTEIKVDSIPPVVFFDRHGHFSYEFFQLSGIPFLPLSFAGQFRLQLCYNHYGLELSVNHPVPMPCFFPGYVCGLKLLGTLDSIIYLPSSFIRAWD